MNLSRLNAILDWSVGVGKLYGVPIRLHVSVIFFLWAVLARSGLSIALGTEYAVLVVFSILLHELGHALTARHYKLGGLSIMLHGFGGFAVSQGRRTPKQQLMISLAGPAVTFAVGLAALGIGVYGLRATPYLSPANWQFYLVKSLGSLNLLMGVLNLIPSLPFDGGNALAALISNKLPEQKAQRLVAHIGLIFTPVVAIFGFLSQRNLIGIFGLMGFFGSLALLLNTGGVRFGEAARDWRARKEEEAFRKRQQERNDRYLSEVADRARQREEEERLRKLLG